MRLVVLAASIVAQPAFRDQRMHALLHVRRVAGEVLQGVHGG
jgi:hypothetical protein